MKLARLVEYKFVLFIAGVVYFLCFPHLGEIKQNIYVDENAIGVGGASARIEPTTSMEDRVRRSHSRRALIVDTFEEIGMEVSEYTPNVTCAPAFEITSHPVVSGTLRAPRGDGKECMVLVVEYDEHPSPADSAAAKSALSGLTIVLELVKYLKGVQWLSKDVTIVAVQKSDLGRHCSIASFNAWVDAYFEPFHPSAGQPNFVRGGVIVAAFVLDIPIGVEYNKLSILAGGPWGLLPNLDLVSIATFGASTERIPVVIADNFAQDHFLSSKNKLRIPEFLPSALRSFLALDEMQGLMRFMLNSVSSDVVATGYHGRFLKHNIDALTIQALSHGPSQRGFYKNVAKYVETLVRSISNLIEKLHHSTFFYILMSSREFVTLEKYFPAFVLVAFVVLIETLSLFYTMPKGAVQRRGECAMLVATVYIASFCVWQFPALVNLLVDRWGSTAQLATWACFAILSTLASVLVFRTIGSLGHSWRLLKSISLLCYGVQMFPLCVLNFSLNFAFMIAIVFFLLPTRPFHEIESPLRKACQALAFVAASPPALMLAASQALSVPYAHLSYRFMEYVATSDNLVFYAVWMQYVPMLGLMAFVAFQRKPQPSQQKAHDD